MYRFYYILFLSFALAACYSCSYSSKATKRLLEKSEQQGYDIVIVPGIPFENGKWDRIMKGRVYWAKFLYDKGIARNVMFSGSAVHTPYYESKIMALYAAAIGIPKENIYIETAAEHSVENIYYSYKKARKLGFEKIAVASDPFQSRMTRFFVVTTVSAKVKPIPFVVDTLKALQSTMTDPVIDYEQAREPGFIALKERLTWWQRLKGTLGRHIDRELYE